MPSERWLRLEQLYHAARERTPAERAAFLDEVCGGDAPLRRDLESLLGQQGGGFLETPVLEAAVRLMSDSGTATGRTLGVYEIQGRIGAGGMGEVYRARDTRLGRDVAIKLLPRSFSDDPDRRARFEREGRLLAALNHPHIAQVYGFEDFDGGHALVMELVEGKTLDEMIGGIARQQRSTVRSIAEALALARQVADGLEAAHQKGIIHRDLKPSNIKVTPSGILKVLDFGLAKAIDHAPGVTPQAVDVATITVDGVQPALILGTAAYMSPEQARGHAVDKRTDIWAFGCVLFELLAGRPPFGGDTVSETLVGVLGREPDWARLPPETPPSIRTLLDRCLRKDPRRRLHDIADARIELDEVERLAATADLVAVPATTRRERLAWILAAALAVSWSATWLFYRPAAPATVGPLEFPISPPAQWSFAELISAPAFEISPDGLQVAVVTSAGDTSTLWVRPIARPAWRQLPGTQGAIGPFWAPDSQSVGFFAGGKLKTVSVNGGAPLTVCDVPSERVPRGAWSSSGVILFAGGTSLRKIAAAGGDSTPATALGRQEIAHRSPSFLPDGDHFLYLAQANPTSELRVGSLRSAETTSLGQFESNAIYASGYLLFVRGGRLMAQPFDTDSRRLNGEPQTIAEDAAVVFPWQQGQFSVSATGRLVYSRVGIPMRQLTWIDRTGMPAGTAGDPGFYANLNLSHDDRRILASRTTHAPGQPWNVDIWLVDLNRAGAASRLTFDAALEADPAWSRDESQIVFNSNRDFEKFSLLRRSSSGSGDNELLVKSDAIITAPEWSPDGRLIMYTDVGATTHRDLWTVTVSGDHKTAVFLQTPFNEGHGTFSPDGRWVAYESDASGRSEIYVRRFPEADKPYPISRDGGRAPRWRGDGRELFFLAPDGRLMAARIETAKGPRATVPEPLFSTELERTSPQNMHPYAVTKDGQRFLMPVVRNPPGDAPITVVLDWPATLRK